MTFNQRCALFGQRADRIRAAVEESPNRREMEFLYATMPLSDAANYEPKLMETYAAHGRFLRENVEWCKTLPEEVYLNEVLYHRVNSEDITNCRSQFYNILWPMVEGKSMEEAVKAINYWLLEEATHRLTDDRTASPLTVLRCAYGRCGEESTFGVTALRSVGIPARQVYSPKWPHCDDNHAWVEVWCDGKWHYMGACEPEEVLDRGWFTAAASRAMLVHSRTFGDTMPGEEFISKEGCMSLWNQLPRYANPVELTVTVTENGQPCAGALVKGELLNYAQFSPIANQLTDESGAVRLTTGLGDLHLHVMKDGRFLTRKIDLRQETTVSFDMAQAVEAQGEDRRGADFEMHPPKDDMRFFTPMTEEVKLRRQEKFDAAVAKRRTKESAFPTAEQAARDLLDMGLTAEEASRGGVLAEKARSNAKAIMAFLSMGGAQEASLRLDLLESLTDKDYTDCQAVVLEESFQTSLPWQESFPKEIFVPYLMCPRIGLEKLTLWRHDLPNRFTQEQRSLFRRSPEAIGVWIKENISHDPSQEYDELITTPLGLLDVASGNPRSAHVLFVAVCRSLGIPARLAPDDHRPQFWDGASFQDGMPKEQEGKRIAFTLTSKEAEPWVYTQTWTLGRLENGQYVTLDLADQAWTRENGVQTLELSLLEGNYRLLICKRMPSGALFAKEYRFEVKEGGDNALELVQRTARLTDLLEDRDIPDFTLYEQDGTPVAVSQLTGDKANLLLWLEEGKEPTEHILNEMEDFREEFCNLPAQITFVIKSDAALRDARIARALDHIPGIRVLYDDFRDAMSSLARRMYVDPDKLPLVVLTSRGLNGIYASSGYNVGLGDLIVKIFQELK